MMTFPEYQASDFGKVAVLMGGQSAERAISLESGHAVQAALQSVGIDAHALDFGPQTLQSLINGDFSRAFIAVHGRGGEDGILQGFLEVIGLPYTGSKVLGSALAMDKMRSKAVWQEANLSTPDTVMLKQDNEWHEIVDRLQLPMMVKPIDEGSSFGASKVTKASELPMAWSKAKPFGGSVMAERWITGNEYTVAIVNDNVLPLIKLETPRPFYDYQAKYEDNNTAYICPCGLDSAFEKTLGDLSLKACQVLGVSGWARVDLIIDADNKAWLIEVNTIPGMTSHSLVPMAAKQIGMSFEQLAVQILATSMTQSKQESSSWI